MAKRKYLFIILSLVYTTILIGGGYYAFANDTFGWRLSAANKQPLPSRQVMEYTQTIVRKTKPNPPEAARAYAYVSSVYSDVLDKAGRVQALGATQAILDDLYPAQKDGTAAAFASLRAKDHYPSTSLNADSTSILSSYRSRLHDDNFGLVWDGKIPAGAGKWHREKTGAGPFAPMAGSWKRWVVSEDISTPAPPIYGSQEFQKELSIVQASAASRTAADVDKINFWGGTPGTETPSGIWQNQLYKTVSSKLPYDGSKDKVYAHLQKVLAMTLADAFMECWKVKYTYWTARPSMKDSTIQLAMANPPFPGYVSGHSTVSKAAADVLSVMVPADKDAWEQMAVDARDSRLVAGIHFENDNTQGFNLGTNVAKQVIANAHLHSLISR